MPALTKAVGAGIVLSLVSSWGLAASPGVPSLGSSAQDYVAYAVSDLPAWFTAPPVANSDNTPVDNAITNEGAELGRVLFYDKRLSHNNGTACASCHTQETGFSDPDQFSSGFEGGLTGRHSMGLSNAKFYSRGRFFWDERAATLEDQVLMPIQDAVEMGSNLPDLVNELQQTDYYPTLFERAFGDSTVTSDRMSKAMAQFVRSMASYQSEFDQAVDAGNVMNPDFAAVASISDPQQAEQGHALFVGDCAICHSGVTQSAPGPRNIGLDAVDTDSGAGNGRFKVPSLRNIAERGRYMHDGRFESLEEVVEFYSSGVQNNPNLSTGLTPGGFNYTEAEKQALIAYMETFSDSTFLTSALFTDPFVDLPGDYDGNGVVDQDDYTAWRDAFGQTTVGLSGPLFADGNNDGVVDAADYVVWRDNLGARWDDGVSIATAVPEPAGLALLFTALLASRARPQRRSA